VSPKIWPSTVTVKLGIITKCLRFVKSFGSFVVVHAVLGLTEDDLLPGTVLYASDLYSRWGLAFRIGKFYMAASLFGAFGGR
jgi:hypothetical protein